MLLLSAVTLVYIAYFAWKRDKIYISMSLIAISINASGYAFEILCANIEWVKFWVKVEYLGGSFFGVLWLMFALEFTGKMDNIKKRTLALLYIVPAAILIINWTNDFHHWFYKEMYMNNNGIFSRLEVIHGSWYWVHTMYNYALTLMGMIIFIITYLKAVSVIRKQMLLLIISCIIPWIGDAVYIFGLAPFDLDLCPLALSLSGILYSFAVLKFKFLKLTPIALEKVFSNMQDGVIILDSENTIVNFNDSSKHIFPELNYLKAGEKISDEVLEKYQSLVEIINNNKNENLISIKNQNELKHYKINISDIYEENKKSIGKILTFDDITESKKQQEKLFQLNNFKDKLFTVVSHDIKSPLSVLLSLLELLEDEEDIYKEENKEILYEIKANVKNTHEMVENVLNWFRSQMDGTGYHSLSWNLSDIMKNSLMLLNQNAKLKGIEVFSKIPKHIFIYGNRDMLEIVIRNLFSNAIKFTNKGGSIEVRAQESEGIVTIAVSDSGIGIESEKIDKLFSNSNFHNTLGTLGEKGTGLGLIICKEFIEKSGGRIWAESIAGKGSTFFFTIASDKMNSKNQ